MKIEKRGNGYRVRKMFKGTTYTAVFDHKPNQMEVQQELTRLIEESCTTTSGTFDNACKAYLAAKRNVLSPSTIKGYNTCYNALSDGFKAIKLKDINQLNVQTEINTYALTHSPKSCRNLHGYISAVLQMFKPNLVLHTTLPQAKKVELYIPTHDEVKAVLDKAKDTEFYIPLVLAMHGLRRSEILAIDESSIVDDTLVINKALVEDEDGNMILKDYNKTTESTRTIYAPDFVLDYIKTHGYAFNGARNRITLELHIFQDRANVPRFRLHDLRHYYASMAHEMGVPDAYIQANCGWKSAYTLNKVYKHALQDKVLSKQKDISDRLFE